MDATKKKILESIGCVVGTISDFARLNEAEAAFLKHLIKVKPQSEQDLVRRDLSAEPVQAEPAQLRHAI